MNSFETRRSHVIRLTYSDTGDVVVEPEDEDRFVLTAQNAVQACQAHHRSEEAIRTFKNELVRPLFDWCTKNVRRVRACYIPVPTDGIQVFIVGVSPRYDFDLGSDVAALELEFADKGWDVSILQLPNAGEDHFQTFFDTSGEQFWFMPNANQHQDKSNHNRAFLAVIDSGKFPDWSAVTAFYTAVHLVERLRTLLQKSSERHSKDHKDRLRFVQARHRAIHGPYHQLFNASLLARYEDIGSFSSQFTQTDVDDVLVNTYLVAIENHVVAQFTSPPFTGS